MKKLIVLTVFLSLGVFVHSQFSFDTDFDGGYNDADESFCVVQTDDGGYVMSGAIWTSDDAGYDIAIMKADESGNLLWVKTYGIGFMNMEIGYEIAKTTDGGFIVCGGTDGFTGDDNDMWVIRTDENGDSLWSKTYGGNSQEYAHSVIQTNDEGFLIAGSTSSFGAGADDVYLIKTDANGDELWSKTYGGTSADAAYNVRQTTDGGYIVGGTTNGYSDFYLIKTDANGDSLWTRTFGGGATEEAYSVKQTTDGGYIMTGGTMSYGAGNYDFWLVKTNEDGDMEWNKTYGGEEKDKGWSVVQSNDGGYFIAGFTESFAQSEEDEGVYLVKTNASGDTLWTRTYGDISNDGGHWAIQTEDGGYAITGYKYVSGVQYNFYLIKTLGDGTVGVDDINNEYETLNIYPNPFNNKTTIEFDNPESKTYDLKITDITGKTVRTINNIRDNRIDIYRQNLPHGFYTIQLRGEKNFTGKIIISD